jgi:hypothetical protein
VEQLVDNALQSISGPACAILGVLGFFAGPFLMAGAASRYLVLGADLGALGLGLLGGYAAYRGRNRWDTVVFGVVLAAISLALWIMAARSGAMPSGGT